MKIQNIKSNINVKLVDHINPVNYPSEEEQWDNYYASLAP